MSDYVTKLKVFLELRTDPLQSYSELARKFDVVPNTVKNWVHELKDAGLLRKDRSYNDPILGERELSEVFSVIDFEKIGLVSWNVILSGIADVRVLDEIRKKFDDHPYTTYQTIAYGEDMTIYARFHLPKTSKEDFLNYINALVELYNIRSHHILERPQIYSSQDNILEITNDSFSSDAVVNDFQNFAKNIQISSKNLPKKQIIDTQEMKFDEISLKLLRELSINGKISPTKLVSYKDYRHLDRSTIAKKMLDLRKNYIAKYGLLYNRNFWGFSGVSLLWGSGKSEYLMFLANYIEIENFPYQSSLFIDGNQFIWYLIVPQNITLKIYQELSVIFEKISMNLIDAAQNNRYYFFPKNFDLSANKWKDDEAYINPLHDGTKR